MEPVLEEDSQRDVGIRASGVGIGGTGRSTGGKAPFQGSSRSKVFHGDKPSLKYREVDGPNQVILGRAQSPPKPVLPRRSAPKQWNATAKERNPLASSLTGPGRAGKYGELLGQNGGRYDGEILAGRPHGQGRYLAPLMDGSGQYVVQYEGEWVQGRKEGMGTRFYANGEIYSGQFAANIRHGRGRYEFANGDLYAGEWQDDRRTGHGTYFYASGDIFVGHFIRDKKEGMGTLYMMSRQRKYLAEYVGGAPRCGTVLSLDDDDLDPLRGQLAALALAKKLDMASSGTLPKALPELQLLQPNKVLGGQFVEVRRARADAKSKQLRAAQAASGTLSAQELEMLRYSFTLMAAGDDTKVGLLPHQLRELCVMAGLDPAAGATHALVDALLERKDAGSGRISFDALMKAALHFREQVDPLLDVNAVAEETLALAQAAQEYAATMQSMDEGGEGGANAEEEDEVDQEPVDMGMQDEEQYASGTLAQDGYGAQGEEGGVAEGTYGAPAGDEEEGVYGGAGEVSGLPEPIPEDSGEGEEREGEEKEGQAEAAEEAQGQGAEGEGAGLEEARAVGGSRPGSAQATGFGHGSRPASAQSVGSMPGSRPASARPASLQGSRPGSAKPPSAHASRPTSAVREEAGAEASGADAVREDGEEQPAAEAEAEGEVGVEDPTDEPAIPDEQAQLDAEAEAAAVEEGGNVAGEEAADAGGSRPGSAQGAGSAQPQSRPASARPTSAQPPSVQGSRPTSAKPPSVHGSRPGSAQGAVEAEHQGSRPASAQAAAEQVTSRPGSAQAVADAEPQGSRPGSAQGAEGAPGSRPASAQAAVEQQGSRPGSAQAE